MQTMPPTHRELATQLAALFAPLSQVEAVAYVELENGEVVVDAQHNDTG